MNTRKFFVGRAIGILVLLAVAGLIWGFSWFNSYIHEAEQAYAADTYQNAEYVIGGERVRLTDGYSEKEIEHSSTNVITRYFGNDVVHDFNADGRDDVAFLITQTTGGSGTFYYLVAALNTADGYIGSEAVFVGDRIAPQSTVMGRGTIVIVNYADRNVDEDMSVQPSVGKSLYLLFDPVSMQFGEVVQDFEGEANPGSMTLQQKTWNWIQTQYSNDDIITPKQSGVFTLTFNVDNSVTIKTDCNSMGGTYSTRQSAIMFENMMTTEMYCEGSQEEDFKKGLLAINSYHFTSKGELIFDLNYDSGVMVFK